MAELFYELIHETYGQFFKMESILFEKKTDHQHLVLFETEFFGRVMALDGIIQTTEKDEFIYHEMLTHVPIFAHGQAKKVLIIGGGDGGMLRETLKHRSIEQATLVEIDADVIELSKEYLPKHSNGAFDDSRSQVIIADASQFVQDTSESYDIIIADTPDPVGPAKILFSEDFYQNCRRCLRPNGILVTQNGTPFLQPEEIVENAKIFRSLFTDYHFYCAPVPTYTGGHMAFGWATDNTNARRQPLDILTDRFCLSQIQTQYYNPGIHQAAFALPTYIQTMFK